MKIVIAGGSGFLGRALSEQLLARRHSVLVLTRGGASGAGEATHPSGGTARSAERVSPVHWTPDGSIAQWASALDGADAVVNLAGEPIAAGRWNDARKRRILDSRVLATRSLVAAIAAARRPPALFVSASGQNYYGDHGDEVVTEDAARGNDFMADVCARWEAEAQKAPGPTRVMLLRTSLVLSATEGALPRMLLPFRLFGGGPVGAGRQFMAWIHWRDWVGSTAWLIDNSPLAGPVNLSTPNPVRNTEFSAAIGRALHRPSWLPAPAFAVKAAVGEMADSLLFTSIRMVPQRLIDAGYGFEFPEVEGALADLLR